MNNNRFVYAKSTIDISRSSWKMPHRWLGSMFHGDLVPVAIQEVLPADGRNVKVSAFIRMSTPIAPIMDNIYFSIAAFFVPKRLIWNKTKEFYGENKEGYGVQTTILEPRGIEPVIGKAQISTFRELATYLGNVYQSDDILGDNTFLNLNVTRAYFEVYNEWFRSENFDSPFLWDHDQVGDNNGAVLATLGGVTITGKSAVPTVLKKMDVFTSCLPWAEKSNSAVLLPLGEEAPIIVGEMHDAGGTSTNGIRFDSSYAVSGTNYGMTTISGTNGNTGLSSGNAGSSLLTINKTNMVADLSAATAATINQIRMAFATQRYLEQLARTGSKYREYIMGMFNTSIGDTTAQMPEYLGGITFPINIAQVLSTAGYQAGSNTEVGQPGASSVTANTDFLYTKQFVEPGYIVIVAYTKHDRTYGQGLDDIYRKHEIFDYYNPKFANLGEMPIDKSPMYFDGDEAEDSKKFGFQEAWPFYRYSRDKVIGALAPSNNAALNFWSLSEDFASAPSLNSAFLHEDRANLVRCLSTGENGPDYLVDIQFDETCYRPMPVYSIPGLIDHH